MNNEEVEDKPNVYFVRRRYNLQTMDSQTAERNIERKLSSRFNVISFPHLDKSIADTIKKNSILGVFQAMITPVPWDIKENYSIRLEATKSYYKRLYLESLCTLSEIKLGDPLLQVVAYTGADNVPEVSEFFLKYGPINEIVFKSGPKEWEKDFIELEKILIKFFY